jgi:hypothetical protein
MDTVGYVVGEVRTDEFTFVTNREIAPPRLEYIIVEVEEPEHHKKVQVLAQLPRSRSSPAPPRSWATWRAKPSATPGTPQCRATGL